MKILLFGGKGYIGSEFATQIQKLPNVQLQMLPSRGFDGRGWKHETLEFVVTKFMPYAIINCAAFTGGNSIVGCEKDKESTILSNVIFPKMLAEICETHKIVLGHMSTGCLYDGYTPGGFTEENVPNVHFMSQCSFYTGTKVMTEKILNGTLEKKYIWRIRLPFDNHEHPRNFLTKMLKFDKLVLGPNSLSHKRELVWACLQCLLKRVPFGTYHVCNQGGIRADEIAAMFIKHHVTDKYFRYFEKNSDANTGGMFRANTVLSVEKLAKVGIQMGEVHDAVEESIKAYDTGRTKEVVITV